VPSKALPIKALPIKALPIKTLPSGLVVGGASSIRLVRDTP
jgi:hypothetical protein